MLVTLEQLEKNLSETLIFIKSYIDSCIRSQLNSDTSNIYATAEVTQEQGE